VNNSAVLNAVNLPGAKMKSAVPREDLYAVMYAVRKNLKCVIRSIVIDVHLVAREKLIADHLAVALKVVIVSSSLWGVRRAIIKLQAVGETWKPTRIGIQIPVETMIIRVLILILSNHNI